MRTLHFPTATLELGSSKGLRGQVRSGVSVRGYRVSALRPLALPTGSHPGVTCVCAGSVTYKALTPSQRVQRTTHTLLGHGGYFRSLYDFMTFVGLRVPLR